MLGFILSFVRSSRDPVNVGRLGGRVRVSDPSEAIVVAMARSSKRGDGRMRSKIDENGRTEKIRQRDLMTEG